MKKKFLSLFMVIAITIFNFVPFVNVHAEGGIGQTGTSIVKTDELQKESTVYAGEIFVDGSSQMQWLYSSDISNLIPVFENLKTSLNGTTFADLVPTLDENTDNNGLAVSSSHQSDMNNSWTSANYVANQFYTGTIGTETNGNLYDNNTTYKNNIDTSYSSHQGEVDNPIDFSKRVLSTLSVASDSEIVSIEGVPTRVITITFNLEATTVIYTSVNVTTSSTTQYGHNNIWTTSGGQVAVLYENRDTSEQADLDGNHYVDLGHAVDYVVGDSITVKAKANDGYKFVGWYVSDVQKGAEYYYRDQLVSTNANYTYQPGVTTISGIDGTINYLTAAFEEDTTPTQTTPTYEYIDNTANQTYTINEDDALTFRINADFSLFENGGKVYVDGTETKDFTASSGSTIITFAKEILSLITGG